MSYLGLLGVLRATRLDMKLAGLKIKKGGEYSNSTETILLQTKLVHVFAEYLEYTLPLTAGAESKPVKPNAMNDYGDDDYGDYGDYNDEFGSDDGFDAALKNANGDFGFDVGAFGSGQGGFD